MKPPATWTDADRAALIVAVDEHVDNIPADPDLAQHITRLIEISGLPDTKDTRRAFVLGAVMHSIGIAP